MGFEPTTPGLKVRDPLTPQDNARFGQLGLSDSRESDIIRCTISAISG